MKRNVFLLIVFWATLLAQAVERTNLKVLYVGGHSDMETFGAAYDTVAHEKGVVIRTAAWKMFLEEYFTTVQIVRGNDYDYKMSYDFDVTIIDGDPKPLIEKKTIYVNGRYAKQVAAKYFPDDFDRPVITIAEEGETVGRYIGTKNDWYCLCLLGKAFNLNRGNEIFKGPYPVKITLREQPTPEGAKEYARMMGDKLPAMTPMWTVHERDYGNTRGYKVGMVVREWGYLDSPDTEVISGGQCAKSYDAIAIGRHANFLSWGFAASPADMTDEAKPVFANAVVYMAQFKGHRVIARKLNKAIRTRTAVDEKIALAERRQYDDYAKMIRKSNEQLLHMVDSLKRVQATGGTIDPQFEPYMGLTADQMQPVPTYEQFMERQFGDLYARFGSDTNAYKRYFLENRPYFYGTLDGYELLLDEDVKSWGVANNDKKLLDKAVTMWEKNQDVEKAKRVLYRYTLLRYDNPKDFRAWLKKYGDKLFFTESGGWLWLVNDFTPSTPGNDYSVLKFNDVSHVDNAPATGVTSASDPVVLSSSVMRSGKDCELTIRVKIHPGYHIYNIVSEKDPYIQTTYDFTPEGCQLVGELKKPLGRTLDSNGSRVYEGDVLLKQKFTILARRAKLKIAVNYQACDAHACLVPQTKTLEVEL